MNNHTTTLMPDDDRIPEILVDAYNNMDEAEKTAWSREAAQILIDDMIRYDRAHGYKPLPYELEDVFTFILALIRQDTKDSS